MDRSYFIVESVDIDDLRVLKKFDSTWTMEEVGGLKDNAFGVCGTDRYYNHLYNCYVVNFWEEEQRVEVFEIISFNHDNNIPVATRIDNYSLDDSYLEWLEDIDVDEWLDKKALKKFVKEQFNKDELTNTVLAGDR